MKIKAWFHDLSFWERVPEGRVRVGVSRDRPGSHELANPDPAFGHLLPPGEGVCHRMRSTAVPTCKASIRVGADDLAAVDRAQGLVDARGVTRTGRPAVAGQGRPGGISRDRVEGPARDGVLQEP